MMRIKSSISSDSKEKLTEKAFKQSIILSFLSIFLCIVALCSTTFAWFTDEVSTGSNKIVSGALKIGLEYKTNWSDEWTPVDENTNIFKDGALYEPGYTEIVFLRISNAGDLALKYNLMIDIEGEEPSVNVNGEPFRLSDYLEIGTRLEPEYKDGFTCAGLVMPLQFGNREDALTNIGTRNTLSEADLVRVRNAVLLPGEQTAQVMAIVLTMPEDLTNGEVNYDTAYNAPEIDLKIKVAAVQHAYESDSFDDQYDADASLKQMHEIDDLETLIKAFDEGGLAKIVNMYIADVNVTLGEGKSLDLNMNNSTLEKKSEEDYAIVNKGDLSLTGDGTIISNMKGSVENWGTLYVNHLNIDVQGTKYGFHVKAGEVEINDLTLTAQRGGLNVQGGKLTVNSGSFTTTAYGTNTGYLVYAASYESAEVIINGGDYRYEGAYYRHGVLYAGQNASIVVYGGTFGKGGSNTTKTKWITEASGGTVTIYGGSFEFDPSEFVAEGYEAVKGTDGWWTVSEITG